MCRILLIIIALCQYPTFAVSKGDNKVDLDVRTRTQSDRLVSTKSEDGNMVTYKIEPGNKFKADKLLDGQTVICRPQGKSSFLYVEVKCPKSTDDVTLATLTYSSGALSSKKCINFFFDNKGWKEITVELSQYVIGKMKTGIEINKENIQKEYSMLLREKSKNHYDVDVEVDKPNYPGVITHYSNEGGKFCRIYNVDSNSVISKVLCGKELVWSGEGSVFGCYKIRVHYSGKTPQLLLLFVKYPGKNVFLYYYKDDEEKYSQISKKTFDEKLTQLE